MEGYAAHRSKEAKDWQGIKFMKRTPVLGDEGIALGLSLPWDILLNERILISG